MDPSEVVLTSSLNAVMDGTATPWQEFTMTLVFAIGGQWAAQRDGEQLDTSSLRQKAFSLIGVVLRTEPAWVSLPFRANKLTEALRRSTLHASPRGRV